MKYFKRTTDNEIFAYPEDGSQDHLIDPSLESIHEVQAIAQANENALANFNALSYAQKRAAEYPPMADYIDGVMKGDQAQIDAYFAKCKAVKEKYPKPSEAGEA